MRERGQAYTIEGVIGAIVVVSALVLGIQAVDIAPWTEDATDRQTESLRKQVEDVLAAADQQGALRTAITCVDGVSGSGSSGPHPAVAAAARTSDDDRDKFGILLNRALEEGGYDYSVTVKHQKPGGGVKETKLVSGEATDSSVTVTRQVVLFDTDQIHAFDTQNGKCVPTQDATAKSTTKIETRSSTSAGFYISEEADFDTGSPDSEIYAIVQIRVRAW